MPLPDRLHAPNFRDYINKTRIKDAQ